MGEDHRAGFGRGHLVQAVRRLDEDRLANEIFPRFFPVAPAAEMRGDEFQGREGVDDPPDADGIGNAVEGVGHVEAGVEDGEEARAARRS